MRDAQCDLGLLCGAAAYAPALHPNAQPIDLKRMTMTTASDVMTTSRTSTEPAPSEASGPGINLD
jgi:hypothetical protein